MNDNLNLTPYDRLQSILSEKNAGKLTDNASEKLDFILNIPEKKRFALFEIFQKIWIYLKRANDFIFPPRNNKFNTIYQKRKK